MVVQWFILATNIGIRYGENIVMKFDSLEEFISKCAEISEQGTDIYIVGAGVYGKKIACLLNENKINWKYKNISASKYCFY